MNWKKKAEIIEGGLSPEEIDELLKGKVKAAKRGAALANGMNENHYKNYNSQLGGSQAGNSSSPDKHLQEQDGRDWVDNPPQTKPSTWSELIPLDHYETLPFFPLDALPPATREFVHAVSETVQAPFDMVGSCVLGTLQIACRGRYPVRLQNGHIERPCLYIAPIAPPSERKSGIMDIATRPLVEYEMEYNQEHGGEVSQSRSELKILQGRIANAEQAAIKAKKTNEQIGAERELQDLNYELAAFETIEPLRLFGADVTPEKLAAMLKSQKEIFALVSAEGGGIFENIGRYSDKGGLEIYLNGYSGDRVCVDRKNSESIVIGSPTLTIIAPCQPSVIADLFSDKQKSGRGLLSRILFTRCFSRVGSRKAMTESLDERILRNYRNLCFLMFSSKGSGNLEYDKGGFDVYASFFDEIEPQLTPDTGELSALADWAGKLPGQMTRLAGLIHCITAFEMGKDPLDTKINAEEARAAVELAKYYLAHAKAVYTEQAEPESVGNARYLWGHLKNVQSIGKRQLIRKTHGKQNFNLDESLSVLAEHGYICVEKVPTGGRPSETIVVNPEAGIMVTKVTKAIPSSTLDALDTKVTMLANVPDVPDPDFTKMTSDEISDCPFANAPTREDAQKVSAAVRLVTGEQKPIRVSF